MSTKPQRKKQFTSRAGAEHAMRERTRGAGFHGDRRMKRQGTRNAIIDAAVREWE